MPPDKLSDWFERGVNLYTNHSRIAELTRASAASALIDLHELMLDAPHSIATSFSLIDEEELIEAGISQADAMFDIALAWNLPSKNSQTDWAFTLAAQIRALDRFLYENLSNTKGSPREFLIEVANKWTLIPRVGQVLANSVQKTGQPYTRRGIVHYRAIPRNVGEYRVEIIPVPSAQAGLPDSGMKMAAALVKGVRHVPDASLPAGRFAINEIIAPEGDAGFEGQLEDAARERSWLFVWPELTVDERARHAIARKLKNWPIDIDDSPPAIVVTGSCHEKVEGVRVNRAIVLGENGRELAEHRKLVPYYEGSLGQEDIVPGKRLCLLMTRTVLIAIGICKDFADLSLPLLYEQLGIDIVIVPSMGRRTTAAAHVIAAKTLRTRTGAAALIIQQADPECSVQTHYFIPPGSNFDGGPDGFSLTDDLITTTWP